MSSLITKNNENEVVDFGNGLPYDGESYDQYYMRITGSKFGPNSAVSKFGNLWSGMETDLRDTYDKWYNEQSAAKKAQADYEYTRMLNSTKYVDEVNALKAAGLNPYAILAGNGMSAGNMSYSSSEAPMRSKASSNSSISGKAVAAIGIIIAAIIKAVA